MESEWIQIGVGGVFALLIIREIIAFLKHFLDKRLSGLTQEGNGVNTYRNPFCSECRKKIDETHAAVKEVAERKAKIEDMHLWLRELFEMHNHKDSDGVYVWYVKRSFEDAVDQLAEAVNKQTLLLERLIGYLGQQQNLDKKGI